MYKFNICNDLADNIKSDIAVKNEDKSNNLYITTCCKQI